MEEKYPGFYYFSNCVAISCVRTCQIKGFLQRTIQETNKLHSFEPSSVATTIYQVCSSPFFCCCVSLWLDKGGSKRESFLIDFQVIRHQVLCLQQLLDNFSFFLFFLSSVITTAVFSSSCCGFHTWCRHRRSRALKMCALNICLFYRKSVYLPACTHLSPLC